MSAIATPRPSSSDVRPSNVIVVHAEDLVICGFHLLLDRLPWVRRCLHARSVADGVAVARHHAPRLVLLDTRLAEQHGAGVGALLQVRGAETRVVLLTAGGAVSLATQHGYGAIAHLPRDWPAARLVEALRQLTLGRDLPQTAVPRPGSLSARQLEILGLVAAGQTNAQIAQRLCLSPHTVKQHTCSLYRKLEARNRTHAVHTARERGLLPAA